ncbi:MAG: electron transfer flavoprotein subunit beta/FixA family protein [Chloroflexi bacterium]|nr:electron transfer flavoprotein subunit beta/FixA family protein [Chloroflexota bacterium]
MNIIVCVKHVLSADCAIKVENGAINKRGLHYVVNPYDLTAVEEAVRLKESHGGEVTVVCVGPSEAEETIRSCLAIGADKGIRLWDDAFEGSDSYVTAVILAQATKSLKYDLILCGQKAADTEGGQTGTILAEMLGIPVITAGVELSVSEGGKVTIQRELEKGNREVVETTIPLLLTVETGLSKPRYPKLRAVFAARKKQVETRDMKSLGLAPEQVGIKGSKTMIEALSPPKPKLKKVFTPSSDLSAEERIAALMSGGMTRKESEFLEGSPDSVASTLLKFLQDEKFLE